MTLPEPFDNTNNCFATENEKIASSLTDEEIANLNKINRDKHDVYQFDYCYN